MRAIHASLRLTVALLCDTFLKQVDAISCYGSEAFNLEQKGEANCRSTLFGYSFSSCWEMCGGISYFQGQCGVGRLSEYFSLCKSDPKGKQLCPEILHTSCNCMAWTGWDGKFNGSACPRCDDYSEVPPLMMSLYPDPVYSGIKSAECPPDYDMCFASCHKIPYAGTVLRDGNNQCSFGCMKSTNKAFLELMVSQSLADADYQHRQNSASRFGRAGAGILVNPYSPIHYKECDGTSATYGCETKFCSTNGCNTFVMTFWDKHRILKGFMYPICLLGGIGVILMCISGLPCFLVGSVFSSLSECLRKKDIQGPISTHTPLLPESRAN